MAISFSEIHKSFFIHFLLIFPSFPTFPRYIRSERSRKRPSELLALSKICLSPVIRILSGHHLIWYICGKVKKAFLMLVFEIIWQIESYNPSLLDNPNYARLELEHFNSHSFSHSGKFSSIKTCCLILERPRMLFDIYKFNFTFGLGLFTTT